MRTTLEESRRSIIGQAVLGGPLALGLPRPLPADAALKTSRAPGILVCIVSHRTQDYETWRKFALEPLLVNGKLSLPQEIKLFGSLLASRTIQIFRWQYYRGQF